MVKDNFVCKIESKRKNVFSINYAATDGKSWWKTVISQNKRKQIMVQLRKNSIQEKKKKKLKFYIQVKC